MSSSRASSHVKSNDARFGLTIASRNLKTTAVIGLQCRFCIVFGREERSGSKRKALSIVKGWSAPFRYDNIELHMRKQHAVQFEQYEHIDRKDKDACESFFRNHGSNNNDRRGAGDCRTPSKQGISIKSHFPALLSPDTQPIVFHIGKKDIVDVIIGDMFFNPADEADDTIDADGAESADDDNDLSFGSERELNALRQKQGDAAASAKATALRLFKRVRNLEEEQQYSYSVTIPASKATLFNLALRYTSCGTSFRMTSEIIACTYDVMGDPCLRHCCRKDVSKYIRVACAVNLHRISGILCRSWGFSLALDSATHQSTSYLDIRFRVFVKKQGTIVCLHGCALLPMFDRHTGEVMFDMVTKFLNVLCPDWKIRLIGVASDGARNMTGRVAGVVTRLASAMHANCPLTRIWCGAHQLDLVMEYIMSNVVKERFFNVMTAFITHLTRQMNLIAEMKTTCPRIVNRWLSTAKVTKWFKIHRPQLLAHIASKHPASAPSRLWWVSLLALQHFTNCTSVTFCSIQGLTTLLEQQQAALNDLVSLLKDDVGVIGPLTAESIGELDASTHVIEGSYAVSRFSVHDFLSGLASWIDTLIEEASDADRNNLLNDIGSVYVTACNRIDSICVHRNDNNDRFDDPTLLPPVLPHEVVKLSASQFLRKIRKDTFRLDHCYSACQIDLIADEQKALRYAYRSEPVLKNSINQLSGRSSFEEGWSVIDGTRFQNLMDYCGVVATLFPGTSTVESDFSVLRWEKDGFRKRLSDFGLEGVMQAKQYCFIQQLLAAT